MFRTTPTPNVFSPNLNANFSLFFSLDSAISFSVLIFTNTLLPAFVNLTFLLSNVLIPSTLH